MTERNDLIFALLEGGPDVKEDELNDWYDNEHAPSRLTVPGVVFGARYKAIDSQKPTWLTLLDIETAEVATSPEYAALATRASEREKTIMPKLAGVSRRTYKHLSTVLQPQTVASDLPSKYILTVGLEPTAENEEDFNKWYDEEHMVMLNGVPGWKRGRRYTIVGTKTLGKFMADQPVPKYMALHEVDNADFDQTEEFEHMISTEWSRRVRGSLVHVEVRKFELHKIFARPA